MMGYLMAMGPCFGCGKPFMFNPNHVPSITIKGEREPICKTCIERANPLRKANGIPEVVIDPRAYEPMDENEL